MARFGYAFVMVFIATLIPSSVIADECDTATKENNPQRSTAYIVDPTSASVHCDIPWRLGWYHFTSKAGQEMPTICPPLNSCGTTGSIWANGSLPVNVGDYANMNACVRVKGNCCASSWSIRVKKCSKNAKTYFVYLLRRPSGCSMAYCAGKEKRCPPGSNSPTGFTPGCTKSFPLIVGDPVVIPGVENKRIKFQCEFKSDDKDDHSIFEVTWYQGAPAIKIGQELLKGGERIAKIQNHNKYPNDPTFYLGTTISCRVRSWFSYSTNKTSSYKESNHYFAGITVEPRQLRFTTTEAGKPLKLTVKATVPVVCQESKTCSVLVDLGQDNTQNFLDLCTVVFKPGPANQTKIVEVVAKRDFVNDGDRIMVLKIDVLEHIDPVDWNQHKKVPNIQIMAEDVGTAQCRSSGDPHLMTFDKLNYNHYQVGDYVLVNSSCRRFEVHIRTWRCASVSCNCGVAVREGDDVVVVDMCRDRIPRARFASTTEPASGTSIRRDNNGKSFIVTFPSGAFVRVDTHRWFGNWYYANFVIQVPSDDYKCTNGLCGTFDGNKNNEMIDKNGKVYTSLGRGGIAPAGFAESWKLPVGSSLFYYKGAEAKCDAKRVKHFCTCQELCCGRRVVDCNFKKIADRPKYIQGFKGWKNLNFPGGKNCGKRRRRRRSTRNDIILPDDDDVTNYIYDPAPILKITIPDWPTVSGKTQKQVTSYCENTIKNSEPGNICKSIRDFDFTPFITQCIEDIQITDNFTFAGSAIRTMQDACEDIFLTNISYWQQDINKNNSLQPPTAIANTLCPNLCSGYGKCVNATCICDAKFTSADCSIEKNKGPTVQSIPKDGLCDVRKRNDCLKTRINGYDFLDSDQLSCGVTEIKISDKPFTKTLKRDVTPGYLLSFAEILCELKSHPLKIKGDAKNTTGVPYAGYLLDVSNDGLAFSSKASLYLIYDSKCMHCKADTGACSLKADTCLINGYCFTNGEAHQYDSCSICDSNRNINSFSIATTAKCEGSKKTDNKGKMAKAKKSNTVVVAVCSVLACVVAVAIVALIIMKVKKKQNATPMRKIEADSREVKTFVNATFDA